MTKKRSSEIFTLKMEIFPEIGPRKNFLVPQIRRQVSAHGYDFVFYSLRYFEPVEFFENRSDVVVFWGFSNSTGESKNNTISNTRWFSTRIDFIQKSRALTIQESVSLLILTTNLRCAAVNQRQ